MFGNNLLKAPFRLEPFDLADLESRTEEDGRRVYYTPSGSCYPSVTTVLGDEKNEGIEAWRNRVGAEKADRITTQAANRGSMLHQVFEDWVKGELDPSAHNPIIMNMFKSARPILEKNISVVHNLEFATWSDTLKIAGRCDCLCVWDGKLSILDYKTSSREKREEWILKYFLQETVYGLCLFETEGLKVEQIVTLIALEDGPPQVFVKPISEFVKPAIQTIKKYYERHPE